MSDFTHSNRLAHSSSPYLLLHAHNPVDWYPWGPEAIETARREDKPIFLSVGYSTCYWCHVMERESFSDEETAALMNQHFVNIKLDREERPELDEIYMTATQIMTQHGGWPNSVFLTPKLEPYFAGTYFPPIDRPGLPGFKTVLLSMANAWQTRRSDVEEQAESIATAIRHQLQDRPDPAEGLPSSDLAEKSLASLERSFDPQWGGFGGAPKFPSPSNLFLLAEFAAEKERSAEMLTTTLDHLARGGIYDQLGGGFHRYATDREWNIPHFEKMLYDNGWLLELYALEWERTQDPQARRVLLETAGFLERELTSPEGAFWSARDAETDGHEGAFYVWTRDELFDALGQEDFGYLAPIYGFDQAPFFEGNHYVLHLPVRLSEQAARRKLPLDELANELVPLKEKLFDVRSRRKPVLTDDKILCDWNGTAISGLATAGRVLGEPRLVAQAVRAAEFVFHTMRGPEGTLLHSYRAGSGSVPAFLSDYAFLTRGLLALVRVTGDSEWIERAGELVSEQESRLGDSTGGFFAAAESDDVMVRSKEMFDGAMPSANAVAILNLIDLAEVAGEPKWRELAERSLKAFAPVLERLAEPARMMTIAARRAGSGEALPSQGADGAEEGDGQATSAPMVEIDFAPSSPGDDSFEIKIRIADGWHIYAEYPGGAAPEWVRPLEILGRDVELEELTFSEADELPAILGEDRIRILEKNAWVRGRMTTTGDSPELLVRFQACNDQRCLAPAEHRIAI